MSIRPVALVVASFLLLAPGSRVSAYEVGKLLGSSLEIVTVPSPKLIVSLKGIVDTADFATDGDPRCEGPGGGGASLRVNGGPGNDFTIVLPCQGWRTPNGSPTDIYNTHYVYADASGTTCKKIVVKHGTLVTARCVGPQVAYTLGQAQGNIDVTLRLGSVSMLNCATFGPAPTTVRRDGSNGKKYVAKRAPAPASCTSP